MKLKNVFICMIIVISLIISVLVLTNIINRDVTFDSIDQELIELDLGNLTKEEHMDFCFNLVSGHFEHKNGCFWKHINRNIYTGNYWENLEDQCVSCVIQNSMLQHCLLEKFTEDEVSTEVSSCMGKSILIHYYTKFN